MKWKKWTIAAILVTVFVASPFAFKKPIAFKNLQDANVAISSLGYFCMSDRTDGRLVRGFAVSREKILRAEANNLVKVGKMGPEWSGKVWFGLIDDGLSDLYGVPDWTGTRVWGNVIVFGDTSLLREIEERLISSSP